MAYYLEINSQLAPHPLFTDANHSEVNGRATYSNVIVG